ncbi:hypothetical protein [Paenibacillus sp. CF095]|uniref:hypothetical protein n=1 Tax=Paenibacillus sp. CF095 TaxID=1881033 RepID=UPI000B828325|nr:hypothetical protein [Paenibacillus sp. CF095]
MESDTYVFDNRRLDGASQDIVNPYIIELSRTEPIYYKGDPLCFKLILIGDAVRYDNYIVASLTQAHCLGIGAERKAFEQSGIFHGDQNGLIWKQGQLHMNAAAPENISPHALQEHASWCSVHLLTPVRIRRGGALVQTIDFPTIIRIIKRRIQLLTERYGGNINTDVAMKVCELASEMSLTSSGLYLNEMHRYSSRKKESVDWSGMLGSLTFEGELSPFIP